MFLDDRGGDDRESAKGQKYVKLLGDILLKSRWNADGRPSPKTLCQKKCGGKYILQTLVLIH